MKKVLRFCLGIFILCLPLGLFAQAAAVKSQDARNQRLDQLEQRIAESRSSADNGWMLMSSALVLLMTGPGLALFYGGVVRKKNVLSTMLQSFSMMGVVSILW